ncbi:hypothetical protein OY671_000882 [Metschnikowia pulcherrima]|nr:hypothetical protein OY671_000882 [Metschnikowia pulcherrima]
MDAHQAMKLSLANIQDEVARISTLATLFDHRPSESDDAFHKRILSEFNSKLSALRAENVQLSKKNTALMERVKRLELRLRQQQTVPDLQPIKARPFKSEGQIKLEPEFDILEPARKKRMFQPEKPHSEILSSPIKQDSFGIPSKRSPIKRVASLADTQGKNELTSSQFNQLATQYSDASSQVDGHANEFSKAKAEAMNANEFPELERGIANTNKGINVALRSSSPLKKIPSKQPKRKRDAIIKGSFASEDESEENAEAGVSPVVADSQDEFEPLGNAGWAGNRPAKALSNGKNISPNKPKYPSHYTALQRVEFLRNYLRPKVAEKNFKIDFTRNPITEKPWAPEDFVRNENWKPPKNMNSNLGVMTKAQEKTYDEFFTKAGLGRKSAGPAWDSDEDVNSEVDDGGWVRSQIMDKYSSPPGYMVGDFASTQEEEERKQIRREKDQDRIRRRFKSALSGGEFVFYEPVFNDFVKVKKFVNGP